MCTRATMCCVTAGWALASAACSSVQLTVHPAPQALELTAAFVYPFGFRWEEPAYRSYELSQRLIETAIQAGGDDLSFFGPGEFKVMRANDDAAWVASTALPLLTATAARPDQGIVLRPWAERRVSSSSHEAQDAKGRRAGASASEETVYIGHLEVIHPSTHSVLLEAQGEIKVDPFAEPSAEAEFDPSPELTALMDRLMRAVVKKAQGWAARRTVQALPPLVFAHTPAGAMRYSDNARGPAELEMARMDAASLELFLQARARYQNPTLTDAEAAKVSRMLPGLWVRSNTSPLAPGDLITTLDGAPASPQAWARLRFTPQVLARVKKVNGEMVEVLLP